MAILRIVWNRKRVLFFFFQRKCNSSQTHYFPENPSFVEDVSFQGDFSKSLEYTGKKKCKLSGSTSNTEHSLLFFTRIDLVIKIAAFFSHLVKIKETLWHMHHRSFTFSLSKISINFPWIFICFFPRNDCYARRDVAIFWISLSSRSNWNSAEGRKEDIEEEWET